MRALVSFVFPLAVSAGVVLTACLVPSFDTGGGDSAATASSGTDAGVDSGFVGGGCGTESGTGAQLCMATTMCPTLAVDVQAMPHCGFRLRGGIPDLVCACGNAICPMGVFDTCVQAQNLLSNQTEASVCAQVAESGRCLEVTAPAPQTPVNDAKPNASSSSGGGTGCDTQCVKDCGGGAACASVCNCD